MRIIQVGPKSNHRYFYKKEAEGDLWQTEEKTHIEDRMTWRWKQRLEWGSHKPKNAGRGREWTLLGLLEEQERFQTSGLQRYQAIRATTSYQSCGNLLQQPQDTNTPSHLLHQNISLTLRNIQIYVPQLAKETVEITGLSPRHKCYGYNHCIKNVHSWRHSSIDLPTDMNYRSFPKRMYRVLRVGRFLYLECISARTMLKVKQLRNP